MSFGNQTVGFVSFTPGAADRLGIKAKTPTQVDVEGCHFRVANADEVVDLTDVATQVWKLTSPPDAAALGAQVDGVIVYDGTDTPVQTEDSTYQIIAGPRPKNDLTGIHHVTVFCKKQTG